MHTHPQPATAATVSPLPTPANSSRRGPGAVAEVWAAVAHAVRDGGRRLLAGTQLSLLEQLVRTMWLLAITLDAFTTTAMMTSGDFEEANPVAAPAMGVIGVEVYIVAASLWCLLLASGALHRPRHVYGHAIRGTLIAVGVVKFYIAMSNFTLWAG